MLCSNSNVLSTDVAIKEGMLAHNSFRLLHHVQPLQWNESLAEQAQRVAKTIANDPSSFQVSLYHLNHLSDST